MGDRKRVVVTGMGLVSCFGSDVNQFYKHLLAGDSGVRYIDQFPCDDFPTRIAAGVRGVDEIALDYIDKKLNRRLDPFIRFSLIAGKRALEHASINPKEMDNSSLERAGVLIGTGVGGMHTQGEGFQAFHFKGFNRVSPFYCPFVLTNMGSALLSVDLGFKGPVYSVSTACATANYSFLLAADHIRRGQADLMIAGGAEASLSGMCLSGFMACRAVTRRNDPPEKASCPWDRKRDGFVMGEGCAALVLESLEHAQARGAPIIAELMGGSMTTDAHHMTDPLPTGEQVARCIHEALEDAGIGPSDIDYINAHATSTPVGDLAELNAIKRVFKDTSRLKMNSTKSMIGHALGAAGGIEAIAAIKAIETQKLHPTINLEDPEPTLTIDTIAQGSIDHSTELVLNNSFGFGGHNSVVVFGRYR